jgi:hypothetical protein
MVINCKRMRKTMLSKSAIYKRNKKIINSVDRSVGNSENSVITNPSSSTNSIVELDVELGMELIEPGTELIEPGMELIEPGMELIENNQSALEEEEPDELFTIQEPSENLQSRLAKWACSPTLCASDVNRVLRILSTYFSHLPLDSRTLKQTPRSVAVRTMSGGQYVHLGLLQGIRNYLVHNRVRDDDIIKINIGIDGLPLLHSELTPILANIDGSGEIFVVGLFYGKGKPADVAEFLDPFICEMDILLKNGLTYGNKEYQVKIRTVVFDAVGKAAMLQIKAHSGKLKKF